ncbi:hypothetical protein HBJ58_14445 [Halomonas desiderata]|uniref:Outer membrane protein beta-barrel domain-containing protein n=1 Tax=Billgrantia desiderata TaxID=52021 RepID=A0AAW4YSS3_9GAMM|nr:hypothetical protein [Halomonas desiderata]MCE8043295.1 hypothetical protein [Halomonas desiderata]MCE8047870.1 hypothetical protein [Halomonas desiderata]MCE8051395.1 hypothetical protein [Halomonas desiderata]NIC37875.1 hypothetical protein [Halomonas desiderata]
MKVCFRGAVAMAACLTLLPLSAVAEDGMTVADEPLAYSHASLDLLAALSHTPLNAPAYAGKTSDLMYLDNGLVLEGSDLQTPDGYTSGFRVTAGFSPVNLPRLDLGAEFTYRESDEVPTRHADQALLVNTTTLGGSLVAGVRLGQLGLYAKSGFAEWEGDPVTQSESLYMATAGTARIQGFGARLQHNRLVSRLEFEEIDAPSMAHLNLITASLHYAF